MAEFNEGDRVRVRCPGMSLHGMVGVVEQVHTLGLLTSYPNFVVLDYDLSGWSFSDAELELVTDE